MIEFAALAATLLADARMLLPSWLPAGKLRGHEFVVGNLAGEPGDSLSINVNTGKWADFASNEKGGDLIALYAAIHRISQADAAKQLANQPVVHAQREKEKRVVIIPVPESAPRCTCKHWEYGEPVQVWTYLDGEGDLLGYVARYEPTSEEQKRTVFKGRDKMYTPWTYGRVGKKAPQWGAGSWSAPRPLYGLDDLARRTAEPVLIVEGEKAADAARKLAAQYVVVTWPAGSSNANKADWTPLAGRTVTLWPDADEVGIRCMDQLGRKLLGICPSVKLILPDIQDGWDAADAVKEGWTWERLRDWARPRTHVLTEGGTHANSAPVTGMATQPIASSNARSGNGSRGDRDSGTAGATALSVDSRDASAGAETAPQSRLGRWLAWNLDRNGNGDPAANLNNAVAVLEHDSTLRGHVWYDSFLDSMLTRNADGSVREWKDFDDINLALYMQRAIGLTKLSREIVSQAVIAIAFRDVRNCVRDWLDTLPWDSEPRIDHFFEDHFGAVATEYTRAASRNFWVSLVARIYQPGCKVDNMIVLEGEQGVGKSNALQIIGGDWFAEQHESASNPKGFGEILQGKWVVEISEMDSFARAELTRVKAVVSNRNDRFRGAYKHYAEDHPRQCVFVGTTNKDDWNRDDTGARRFWPIRCNGAIDVQAIAGQREQLLAEAVHRFKNGESWWQMPMDETRREQRARFQEDPWQEFIARYLYEEKLGDGWFPRATPRMPVTMSQILMEGLGFENSSRISRTDELRVGSCLRVLGWTKVTERIDGKQRKVWRPAESVSEVNDAF